MKDDVKDEKAINRRDFLTVATSIVGIAGAGAATIPFIKAMSPTKDIIAAGILNIDISGIKEGEFKVVMWRKQPIFILKRTDEMIKSTEKIDPAGLKDPAGVEDRVIDKKWLVCIGICTHLGCIPHFQKEKIAPGFDLPGFYCPCHGGKYDTLGRRLDGPPPENLHLVPYKFLDVNKLMIGTKTFAGFTENVRKVKELPKA